MSIQDHSQHFDGESIVAALAGCIPNYTEDWEQYSASPAYHQGEVYNQMTVLATEVLERYQSRTDLRAFFECVERQLKAASALSRHLIVVGLLEDLQNASLSAKIPLVELEDLLGDLTREAWSVLIDMWNRRITADAFNAYVEKGTRAAPARIE